MVSSLFWIPFCVSKGMMILDTVYIRIYYIVSFTNCIPKGFIRWKPLLTYKFTGTVHKRPPNVILWRRRNPIIFDFPAIGFFFLARNFMLCIWRRRRNPVIFNFTDIVFLVFLVFLVYHLIKIRKKE